MRFVKERYASIIVKHADKAILCTVLGLHKNKQTNADSKFYRAITNAYLYVSDEDIHQHFDIKTIGDVIREFVIKYDRRMHAHVDVGALQLLDNTEGMKTTQRVKPYEPVCQQWYL